MNDIVESYDEGYSDGYKKAMNKVKQAIDKAFDEINQPTHGSNMIDIIKVAEILKKFNKKVGLGEQE
jgi:hypothetical protein